MLKSRVMPTLLYRDHSLVKGVGFNSWRPVGMPVPAIQVYNNREVDELVLLDISATRQARRPDFRLIDDLADNCFMPFAVGGGVRSVTDIQELLRVGADKVVINTAAVERSEVIKEGAKIFGSQCIVVSIDVMRHNNSELEVYTRAGTQPTGMDPRELARKVQALGAGELLVTSINRDGTMEGYDIELIRSISRIVSIPVIASGGAGKYDDFAQALGEGGASAVAAASIYHFTEQTPKDAKHYLKDCGFPIRI